MFSYSIASAKDSFLATQFRIRKNISFKNIFQIWANIQYENDFTQLYIYGKN